MNDTIVLQSRGLVLSSDMLPFLESSFARLNSTGLLNLNSESIPSMTSPSFSEISVLIPGYSIEDLPTDLQEDDAASLLNAIACAWHPELLQHSSSIPILRQAESLGGYP
ncbi:MAG: hypothetical protein ACK58L_15320, partial [Planctomycetota bacterium]